MTRTYKAKGQPSDGRMMLIELDGTEVRTYRGLDSGVGTVHEFYTPEQAQVVYDALVKHDRKLDGFGAES